MSKKKYYYAVVKKETGILLLEDHKLPFYWLKSIAKETARDNGSYCVVRVDIETIQAAILSGKIINTPQP